MTLLSDFRDIQKYKSNIIDQDSRARRQMLCIALSLSSKSTPDLPKLKK